MTVYLYPGRINAFYIKSEQEGQTLDDWARELVNKAYSQIEAEARR